jgi:flavin reductase (DIM6/NTAB) family NADH-FMN oxidoreductase RutF
MHLVGARQNDRLGAGGEEAVKAPFLRAMRELVGGVAIISAGAGSDRTGLTATSVSALSAEPPRLLVCINQTSSTWAALQENPRFGVNLLAEGHRALADRFAGRDGVKSAARYEGTLWDTLVTGAPILADALAALDCEVEETISRHSHVIVLGRVKAVRIRRDAAALVYWRGDYDQMGWSVEQIARAAGFAES